jgi:hypothetical protein
VCSKPPPAFGQATGSLVYHANTSQAADIGTGSVAFGANKCRPWPYSELLDFENPTCDIRKYQGGTFSNISLNVDLRVHFTHSFSTQVNVPAITCGRFSIVIKKFLGAINLL